MIVQGQVEGSGPWCEWQSEAMRQQSWTEVCPQGSNTITNSKTNNNDNHSGMHVLCIIAK